MTSSQKLQNPLIPGFHPDPSICRVGDDYYLACSSFEYLPGLPVFHSQDLADWTLIGHVATRPGQLGVGENTPTSGGAWAPTIRHHDGRFFLVVTDAIVGRGTLLFTADDAAGPWSDGVELAIDGIDPDICWDDDGICHVTFSGLQIDAEAGTMQHAGIQQVTINPDTGEVLTEPRSLYSGTGGMFPEAPHLYHIDNFWYLVIAEGGTERGHSVSVARAPSPTGPFEANPANPILTARGTDRAVQNTGHGDLVQTADGEWLMVLLGVRPRSMTRAFSPMGRETFITRVGWQDGWPTAEPVELSTRAEGVESVDDFDGALGPDWVGVRRMPTDVADLATRPSWLSLTGEGTSLAFIAPVFVGRRQEQEAATFTVHGNFGSGAGGLAMRYDEDNWVCVRVDSLTVQAQVHLTTIEQTWMIQRPDGIDEFSLRITADPGDGSLHFGDDRFGCDLLRLSVSFDDPHDELQWIELASVDGRFLSSEVCESFTGRVAGVYAEYGTVQFDWFAVSGVDVDREQSSTH